jgi:sugar phosphate isomerase/epimerase
MQFGVCGAPSIAASAAHAGFDFFESSVGALLKPRELEEAFLSALAESRAAGLPCPVVNCFVPGDLKITGPEVDFAALEEYVTTTFERAARADVEVIVFGSGGARQIPEGFDAGEAHGQLVLFCSMFAPIAERHGVVVVMEPLNRQECNVLNTVGECATLVREVGHPGLRLLVDAYHLLRDGDSCGDIVSNGGLLRHVHVATIPNRLAPGAEPCDFFPFFDALIKAGYNGRISIEGNISSPESELSPALLMMSGFLNPAGE